MQEQLAAQPAPVSITMAPLKGRTTRWGVKCTACKTVGVPQINKYEAQKVALHHAEETHDRNATIRLHR